MDSQRELVVAAEALKTWVISQRSARTSPSDPGGPAPFESTDIVTATPPVWTAASSPIVFPTMPTTPPARALAPAFGEPQPSLPVWANERVAKGMGAILPQVVPRLAGIGRVALKVAAGVALLAAVGGAAMVGKIKWNDYAAARRIGTATFASVPSGAQIYVDGQPVGTTPVRVELPVGTHSVELHMKGVKRTESINIVSGQDTGVAVDWKAKPLGGLLVTSVPVGAKVTVDGRARGVTPLTLRDLSVGTHTVLLESPQGSVRRTVTIADGKTETLSESIYAGWLHVSAPMEVAVAEGTRALQLDSGNRVLLKPGVHEITVQNRPLGFSLSQSVEIEPGATATLDVETPFSTLTVNGPEGATVLVDGVKAGETPLANYRVQVGTRDVVVVDRSGATYHMAVTVTRSPAQVNVEFSKP